MNPHRAQPVVLRLPGRDDVRAFVEEADDRQVTLVLALRREADAVPTGADAVVEYTSASGVHRLTGRIGDGQGALVRVDRALPADEHIQRREWARADADVPVELELRDIASGRHTTVAVNVSGGGALLTDPVGLPIGAQLHLTLNLDEEPLQAEAVVVRETPSGEKGVRITAIADGDRERLVRFVLARQRAELARRKAVVG